MKIIKEIYFHIKGTETAEKAGFTTTANYVKASVYYHEGGFSCLTYKNTPRAYYMAARTIGRGKTAGGYMESCGMFEGRKLMIGEPVTRQTAKKEAAAVAYFNDNIEAFVRELYPELGLEKEA